MPRVHHRKARKDYPASEIKKGDMYFTWRIKSAYGGTTYRSPTRPKSSQLTHSPFKSGFLSVGEDWDANAKDVEAIRSAGEAIREVGAACNESYENMPEGLQEAETGQIIYTRAEECESKAAELDGLADEYEDLTEPDHPGELEDATPDNPGEDHLYDERKEAWEEAHDEYQTDLATYKKEQDRIVAEAGDLIWDMPE